jgi:hypothetical protein
MPGIATPGYLVMPNELRSPCESAGKDESNAAGIEGPRPDQAHLDPDRAHGNPTPAFDRRPPPHGKQRPGGCERRPAFDPPSQPPWTSDRSRPASPSMTERRGRRRRSISRDARYLRRRRAAQTLPGDGAGGGGWGRAGRRPPAGGRWGLPGAARAPPHGGRGRRVGERLCHHLTISTHRAFLKPPVANQKVVPCAMLCMAYGPENIPCAGGPGGF